MSEVKKDVQQAMQPNVNALKGKLPSGEKIDLEEHQVATNGDCGFIGLGFDRGQVADQLLTLIDDTESREFLAEEILSALMLEEFVTIDKEWIKLAGKSREQQTLLDDWVRKIKSDVKIETFDVEGLTQWLYKNKPEGEELKVLLELRRQLATAEKTLRDYISSPDMFKDYVRDMKVEREKKRQWLGYKSALLYAKLTHMTLYIWCKVDKNAQKLRLVDYHDAGDLPSNLIHLLHTDGFTHYNLLSMSAQPSMVSAAYKPFFENSSASNISEFRSKSVINP